MIIFIILSYIKVVVMSRRGIYIPPNIDKIFRAIFNSHVPELRPADINAVRIFQKILDNEEDPCSLSDWLQEETRKRKTLRSRKGTYSKTIFRYLPIKGGKKFPVVIKLTRDELKNEVLNEIKALKILNKANPGLFVNMYAHLKCKVPDSGTYYFEFMEKLDSNLLDVIRVKRKQGIDFWYPILKQIFYALAIMEENKIMHNDFHFGNIMLIEDGKVNVKVIDFSAALFPGSLPIKVTTFFGKPLKHFEAGEDLFNFMDIFNLPKVQNAYTNKLPKELKTLGKFVTSFYEETGHLLTASDIVKMYGSKR